MAIEHPPGSGPFGFDEKPSSKNYYERLGLHPHATEEDVKIAFRQLSKKYHPEAGGNGGDAAIKGITEAYSELKHKKKRDVYDSGLQYDPNRDMLRRQREVMQRRHKEAETARKAQEQVQREAAERAAQEEASRRAGGVGDEEGVDAPHVNGEGSGESTHAEYWKKLQEQIDEYMQIQAEEGETPAHESGLPYARLEEMDRDTSAEVNESMKSFDRERADKTREDQERQANDAIREADEGLGEKMDADKEPPPHSPKPSKRSAAEDSKIERDALLAAEKALTDEEASLYKNHSLLGRIAQRTMAVGALERANLETEMNRAAFNYEQKLEQLLSERQSAKDYTNIRERKIAAGLKEGSTPEVFSQKVAERYRRSVISKDVIDRGEKARADAKTEILATKESSWVGKTFQWLGERNKQLDQALGKNGARTARIMASSILGTIVVAGMGPATAGALLTAGGIRAARGFAGVFGGAGVGYVTGYGYEKTYGAKASRKLAEARTTVASNAADIALKRAAYASGNAETIERNRKIVEAVSAVLAGAGLSLATGYGLSGVKGAGHTEVAGSRASVLPAKAPTMHVSTIKMPVETLPGDAWSPDVPAHQTVPHEAFSQDALQPDAVPAAPLEHAAPEGSATAPEATPSNISMPGHAPYGDFNENVSSGPDVAPAHSAAFDPRSISVGTDKNLGLEHMIKNVYEQIKDQHLNPQDYPEGSDMRVLADAAAHNVDKDTLGGILHRMALDPKHHFFELNKSTGVAKEDWVHMGAKMTIDDKGNVAFSADGHVAATEHIDTLNRVRTNLGLKPHLHPEGTAAPQPALEYPADDHLSNQYIQAHPDQFPAENAAQSAPLPEATHAPTSLTSGLDHAPSTEGLSRVSIGEFIQTHANEAHIYANPEAKHLFVFGGDQASQVATIDRYLVGTHAKETVFGTDPSGKYRIPYFRGPDGKISVGAPVLKSTSGLIGGISGIWRNIFDKSGFMKAPNADDFKTVVQ